MSEWKEITSGIPQGTVLGPIPFVIFINDIPGKVYLTLASYLPTTRNFMVLLTCNEIYR